jgi:hypothetical protein
MNATHLEITAITNPHLLPDSIIQEIQSVSQDIWSRRSALGELCQCEICNTIYAAEDIFTQEELEQKSVANLIHNTYGNEEIPCKNIYCDGKTKYIF